MDFDRLNAGMTRFSAGAVNVRTGNFVYFDTSTHKIAPRACHGERRAAAWLSRRRDRWRALLGRRPCVQHAAAMGDREQPPPRTRSHFRSISGARKARFRATWRKSPHVTRRFSFQAARARAPASSRACTGCSVPLRRLLRSCSLPIFEENDDLKILKSVASDKVYNIIQLIYRARNYEGHSKDYEFSRLSMQDHWRAGYHDAVRTLRHPEVLTRPTSLMASSRSISNATVVNNESKREEDLTCAKKKFWNGRSRCR